MTINKIVNVTILFLLILPVYSGANLAGVGIVNFQKLAIIIIALLAITVFLCKRFQVVFPVDVREQIILQTVLYISTVILLFIKSSPAAYGQTLFYSSLIFTLSSLVTFIIFNSATNSHFFKKIIVISYVFIIAAAAAEIFVDGAIVNYFVIDNTDFIQEIAKGKFRDGQYRIMSVFNNPLILSQYLIFITPILFLIVWESKVRYKYSLLLLIYLFNLYFQFKTYSRSGLLLTVMIPFVYYVFYKVLSLKGEQKNILTHCMFILIFLFAVSLPILIELLSYQIYSESEQLTSTLARVEQWNLSARYIMENPFFGNGSGNSLYLLQDFIRSIDNYYLTILMEQGIFGLLIRFTILVVFTRELICLYKYRCVASVSLLVSLFLLLMSYSAQSMNYGLIFICIIYIYYCYLKKDIKYHV